MKAQALGFLHQGFQKGQGMSLGVDQEGIVVEHKIPHAVAPVPVDDFVCHGQRVPAPPLGLQPVRGAVVAAEGAAHRGQQGGIGNVVLQIESRVGPGIQIVEVKSRRDPVPGVVGKEIQKHRPGGRSGHDFIRVDGCFGVRPAEGGVDAAQDDRRRWKNLFYGSHRFRHAGVPVGHDRGHQDKVRR